MRSTQSALICLVCLALTGCGGLYEFRPFGLQPLEEVLSANLRSEAVERKRLALSITRRPGGQMYCYDLSPSMASEMVSLNLYRDATRELVLELGSPGCTYPVDSALIREIEEFPSSFYTEVRIDELVWRGMLRES